MGQAELVPRRGIFQRMLIVWACPVTLEHRLAFNGQSPAMLSGLQIEGKSWTENLSQSKCYTLSPWKTLPCPCWVHLHPLSQITVSSNIGTQGLLPIYSVNSIESSLGNTTSKVKCYQSWKLFGPVIVSTNANAGTKIACCYWFWDGHWWPRIGVYCAFYFEWNHSCYNVNNECSHPQEYACGPPWCKSRIQMI